MTRIQLIPCKRTDPAVLRHMSEHYSQPKGAVGRNIFYRIEWAGHCLGSIAGGSATKHLPGRNEFIYVTKEGAFLQNVINNIFFHVEPPPSGYPERNFNQTVLRLYRDQIVADWVGKYGSAPLAHETLVELPRTGEVYRRDGWIEVGQTRGFTCKRTGGKGTDSWSGARVWDTETLRPKRVFCRWIDV